MRHPDGIVLSHPAELRNQVSLVFTRLVEYDDADDKANVNDASVTEKRVNALSRFEWNISMTAPHDSNRHDVAFVSQQSEHGPKHVFQANGRLEFRFSLSGEQVRSAELPQMEFTSNSTQLTLVMDRLAVNFNRTRFAVEASFIADKHGAADISMSSKQSVDDEYTPGIFTMTTWRNADASYVEWKPVIYLSSSRTLKGSSSLSADAHGQLKNVSPALLRDSLAWVWFGPSMFSSAVSSAASNFSLGWPKDKFYARSNYSTWTSNIGMGPAPQESISSLLILILCVGLGLPSGLVIFAFGFVLTRHCQEQRRRQQNLEGMEDSSSYRKIN